MRKYWAKFLKVVQNWHRDSMKFCLTVCCMLPLLLLGGCQTTNYAVKNTLKYTIDNRELHCNLSNEYVSFRKEIVSKSENIDADLYEVNLWGIKRKSGIIYEHGKSVGVCIQKNGRGYYYTVVPQIIDGRKESWVAINYGIGRSAWSFLNMSPRLNKDFPETIGNIKKLRVICDYNFKSEGLYNNKIVLWIKKPGSHRPFIEVMLKFDNTTIRKSQYLGNFKTDNHAFYVYTHKIFEFKTIDARDYKTSVNETGDRFVDIDLRQVFDYLIEEKLISRDDILPGFLFATEIWDGTGELKIRKLKYEIER